MKATCAVIFVSALLFGGLAVAQPDGMGEQAASSIRVRVGDRLLCVASQDPGETWTVDGHRITAEGAHGSMRLSLVEGGIQVEAGEMVYEVPEIRVLRGGQSVLRGWIVDAPAPEVVNPEAIPVQADSLPEGVPPAPPQGASKVEQPKPAVGVPPAPAPRPSFRVQGKR